MNSTVEYHIILKDVTRGTQFTLKYETDTELKIAYDRYKKNNDYEVIGMFCITLEIRPIDKSYFDNIIM